MNSSIWMQGSRRSPTVIAIAVVAGPALVTSAALLDPRPPTATAALLYVLAVVAVAGFGGAVAGLCSSVLSFLTLNFFFTPPLHTFTVSKTSDLVALMVFLLVSMITGLLLSTALRERARAERREAQATLVNDFSNRLLSGAELEAVLSHLGDGLVALLDLAMCEIAAGGTRVICEAGAPAANTFVDRELKARGEVVGSIRVGRSTARGELESNEVAMLEAVVGQLSLAFESTRLSDEVRRAQVEAETNQLRAALFAGVTHDVKTPLAAITASVTSLIEEPSLNPKDHAEHLDTIKQEAEHLNRLLSNLMDLARVRAGALVPARVPAAIDEVLESVLARLSSVLKDREIRLHLRDDLPEMDIDVVQVDQVLSNLLENAAKFSPPGSPIEVAAVAGDRTVRVTVSDKGPGIPKEERDRMFQAFERGPGDQAGTGLGLAIARAVLVAHGGRIWAQDAPAGGLAVTFELPIEEAHSLV